MSYLYVGYYVNDNTFREIQQKKVNNMSVARQKFECNLLRGLCEQLGNDLHAVTYVPTDGRVSVSSSSSFEGKDVTHIAIQKDNGSSLLHAMKAFEQYLLGMGEETLRNLNVIMYAVIPPFVQVLLKYRKKYRFKLTTICSEVPSLRRYGSGFAAKMKKTVLTHYNQRFDGYVFFSTAMREVVKIKGKPYIVLEGIAPPLSGTPTAGKRNIVMYAGGLAKDNNALLLAQCCADLPQVEEVWICGVGEEFDAIRKLSETAEKVKCFGMVDNRDIVEMERQAKVLVNLRSPAVALTKYSFPSKILEYIASGSLVLSTRLGGIPTEYYAHIAVVEELSREGISRALSDCFTMSDEAYLQKVTDAQAFIENEKNYLMQSRRLVQFADEMRAQG